MQLMPDGRGGDNLMTRLPETPDMVFGASIAGFLGAIVELSEDTAVLGAIAAQPVPGKVAPAVAAIREGTVDTVVLRRCQVADIA